jgi:peptide/nickel transport system permease protein
VYSASKPRSFLDRLFTGIALFFYSIPTFVLGLFLMLDPLLRADDPRSCVFPPSGYVPFTQDPLQWARAMILRGSRSRSSPPAPTRGSHAPSMLEVMNEDYLRTAREEGSRSGRSDLPARAPGRLDAARDAVRHRCGALIGGAVITERCFGLPGLGYTAVRDRAAGPPVIIRIVLVAAAGVVIANILSDLFYAVLDPRVRIN